MFVTDSCDNTDTSLVYDSQATTNFKEKFL